jgi:predicted oxidoreductase
VEPGSEEALDLPAATRLLEPGADDLVLDDDERRHRLDPEAFHEIGTFLLVDSVELERAVVPPALEHLREEAFGTAASA